MGVSGVGAADVAETSPRPARLVRRADRRLIAGVAGGTADSLGVKPLWVRLTFLVLAIGAGAGVLLYLAMWWLIPREDQPESGSDEFLRKFPRAPAWAGRVIVIMGVGVLAILIAPDSYRPGWSPPLVLGFALIAVGLALFRRDLVRERDADPAETPSPGAASPVLSDVSPPSSSSAHSAPRGARTARERSRLGVLTAGSAMIAVSAAVLLDGSGAITLDVGRFPAIALVVLGAGLLVGSWWGRARGALVLGVLILPVALLLSLIHFPFGGGIASRSLYPRNGDPLPASQRLLAGDLSVNLMRVDLAGSTRTLEIEMGAGTVHVVVPRDVTVHLAARVGLGGLRVMGHTDRMGVDLTRDLTLAGRPGRGVLILRVDQGIGSVDLIRARPSERTRRG